MAKRAAEACIRVPSLSTPLLLDPHTSAMRCVEPHFNDKNPQKSEKNLGLAPPPHQCDTKTILVSQAVFYSCSFCQAKHQGDRFPKLEPSQASHRWQTRRPVHQLPLLVPTARGL